VIPGYQVLAQRIRDELEELEHILQRAERAWRAAARAEPDQDMFIDSAALSLHGFYAGLERLLEAIALQLDGAIPKGAAWHRDLLDQMTMNLSGLRPPVISDTTLHALDEYRRFRHVVRNVYAEHLDPIRIGDLVARLSPLWIQLKDELAAFAGFLEDVSRADDTSS
jgi:hypothetical protein